MKVVMTLLVRDEADVVDAQIAYHLDAGVDFVIATDHRSSDETTAILESYAEQGRLRLLREAGSRIDQAECVTQMARLAATAHDADWVILSDADEFWWPIEGSLKDVFAAVPKPFGIVHAVVRTFIPQLDDRGFFAERLTARLAPPAPINDPTTPYRPVAKAAHRAHPDVIVSRGNHEVAGTPYHVLPGSHLVEVLHFPFRTQEQSVRKFLNKDDHAKLNLRGDLARLHQVHNRGEDSVFFEQIALDRDEIDRGLEAGVLVSDTRLRDRLRRLHDGCPQSEGVKPESDTTPFLRTTFDWELRSAVDIAVLAEANEVRIARRLDDLGLEVASLQRRHEVARSYARALGAPLAGIAAFAATAVFAETFTDRDWSLSGLEWPVDFIMAAVLVCLVPLVLGLLRMLVNALHPRSRATEAHSS